MFLKLSIF